MIERPIPDIDAAAAFLLMENLGLEWDGESHNPEYWRGYAERIVAAALHERPPPAPVNSYWGRQQ